MVIAGAVCFGSPYKPGGGGWACSRSLNALAYRWAEIPDTTDVLLTHGPLPGVLDQNARGEHLGCPALAEAVRRVRPRLHANSRKDCDVSRNHCGVRQQMWRPNGLRFSRSRRVLPLENGTAPK